MADYWEGPGSNWREGKYRYRNESNYSGEIALAVFLAAIIYAVLSLFF